MENRYLIRLGVRCHMITVQSSIMATYDPLTLWILFLWSAYLIQTGVMDPVSSKSLHNTLQRQYIRTSMNSSSSRIKFPYIISKRIALLEKETNIIVIYYKDVRSHVWMYTLGHIPQEHCCRICISEQLNQLSLIGFTCMCNEPKMCRVRKNQGILANRKYAPLKHLDICMYVYVTASYCPE